MPELPEVEITARLIGAAIAGAEIELDGDLALEIHLMSAGRLQLFDTRASLRDRTSRFLVRLKDGRELRLREFGTRQRAWVKLLRAEDLASEEAIAELG